MLLFFGVSHRSFLTNHARALLVIANDPSVRLRDIAAALDITERSAYGLVTDLTEAGYVVKEKEAAAITTRSSRTCPCASRWAQRARSAT